MAGVLQQCLTTEFGVPLDDPDLLLVVPWATAEGLVAEPDPSAGAP